MHTRTPSAIAVLRQAWSLFLAAPADPWGVLDAAAVALDAPACEIILAGNALDAAMRTTGRCDTGTFDIALDALIARRLDLDTWLTDCAPKRNAIVALPLDAA